VNPTKIAEALSDNVDLWTPVIDELKAFGESPLDGTDSSLLFIFLAGFAGGFIALLTPCVWPMIPMTVSFFLKRTKNKKKAIKDAVMYGVSIIVIYLALGLLITGIFGASALNDLSTNAVFNLLFFACWCCLLFHFLVLSKWFCHHRGPINWMLKRIPLPEF
jgi:Cytochrome C biogenesis protein transmembrane region.